MEVVELPLNATEDRISGSLNIEEILASGKKRYEPGILAQANNNLLYIDEINLLDDHIVDLLLDSAAMGRNYVEREGISFSHPAKFILVGTMNPEEGSLRPQLLDRFGMCVDIVGETDPATRMAVIKQRLAFDADPAAFVKACEAETEELRARLVRARSTVGNVRISDELIHAVAVIAIKFKMEGHRADLAMIRAAKANAAFEGRGEVTREDISQTAALVLRHRLPAGPFEESSFRQEDLDRCLRGFRCYPTAGSSDWNMLRPRFCANTSTPRSNASSLEDCRVRGRRRSSAARSPNFTERAPARFRWGPPTTRSSEDWTWTRPSTRGSSVSNPAFSRKRTGRCCA